MQNLIQKSASLSNVLRANSYTSTFATTPAVVLAVPTAHPVPLDTPKYYLTQKSINSDLPVSRGLLCAISGITGTYIHFTVNLMFVKNNVRIFTINKWSIVLYFKSCVISANIKFDKFEIKLDSKISKH